MAEKIKINDYGDCMFAEQDVIDILYSNPNFDISKLFVTKPDQFNASVIELGLDLPQLKQIPNREPLYEFDQIHCGNWHMPQKYYEINVLDWLLEKCQSPAEQDRVGTTSPPPTRGGGRSPCAGRSTTRTRTQSSGGGHAA